MACKVLALPYWRVIFTVTPAEQSYVCE